MRSCILLASLFLAGWFGVAQAQPSKTARTVQDDLGMFSAEAKAKANQEIARIKKVHHKDLVVETTEPPKQPKELDVNDKAAVDKFIDQWATEKFKNEQIDGVYVLLVERNKLKKIRVLVGPQTLKSGLFTNQNRDELFQKLQSELKEGDKDGALLAATGYVHDAMQRNARPGATATQPTPAQHPPDHAPAEPVQANPIVKWLLIGLGVLLVIWLVSAVLRGFASMGGGGQGSGGYAPGYGGGGGFMNGFLGGMFGAAAGMWAYNHFFGPSTPSAHAGDPYAGSAYGGSNQPSDVGAGDPSITGGDYGDVDKGAVEDSGDAGGGDWGGGGGGDAGGGDWGGGGADVGGDWGGGGGGDW